MPVCPEPVSTALHVVAVASAAATWASVPPDGVRGPDLAAHYGCHDVPGPLPVFGHAALTRFSRRRRTAAVWGVSRRLFQPRQGWWTASNVSLVQSQPPPMALELPQGMLCVAQTVPPGKLSAATLARRALTPLHRRDLVPSVLSPCPGFVHPPSIAVATRCGLPCVCMYSSCLWSTSAPTCPSSTNVHAAHARACSRFILGALADAAQLAQSGGV